MNKLGPSQRNSVTLLLCGFSRKEIASIRNLAHSSVKNHMTRAARKLGCRTVEQMAFTLGLEYAETVLPSSK